jgi:catechol 2,3-dioxygenase-like lactoylglutathione lyase family enzyme
MGKNWELHHVGLIVWEMDKTIEYYQSLGMGKLLPDRPCLPGEERPQAKMLMYGKPIPSRSSYSHLMVGSLLLEVVQPPRLAPGVHVNTDFLDSNGDGISHICFGVPDIKRETAKLVEKGCQEVVLVEREGRVVETYLDTLKFGNIILSLHLPADEIEIERRVSHMVSNWKFRGVGVAVRDLDKAMEYYQYLDIATFEPEVIFDSSEFTDFKVYGKRPDITVRARTRMLQIGSVGYEFIQPFEGEAIHKEFLDSRGEGIIDIAFTVEDLDKETAKLIDKGVSVILSGKPEAGNAFAHFDIRKHGNIILRLIQAE